MKVHVTQWEDKLRATFEDGRDLVCSDPQELALQLRELGVSSADVTCLTGERETLLRTAVSRLHCSQP